MRAVKAQEAGGLEVALQRKQLEVSLQLLHSLFLCRNAVLEVAPQHHTLCPHLMPSQGENGVSTGLPHSRLHWAPEGSPGHLRTHARACVRSPPVRGEQALYARARTRSKGA